MEMMRTHFLTVFRTLSPEVPGLSEEGKVVEMQGSQNEKRLAQYGEDFPFSPFPLYCCGVGLMPHLLMFLFDPHRPFAIYLMQDDEEEIFSSVVRFEYL